MSWLRHLTLVSLSRLNPKYTVELFVAKSTNPVSNWNSGQQQDFSTYQGRDYLAELSLPNLIVHSVEVEPGNGVQQCDWFKWDELGGKGGWFSDLDILYLKPLPEIEAHAAITCDTYYSMGLMASAGNNEIFRAIARASREFGVDSRYESTNQSAVKAVGKDISELEDKYPQYKIYNIPVEWVYPFSCVVPQNYFKPGSVPKSVSGCIGTEEPL